MKIFVFSDCHGFANELIDALDNAGFDKTNPNHLLVGCGDYFDRGKQPFEVMRFLKSVQNKVLVKGNHEQLLIDAINRGYPLSYDHSNGTFDTICELGHAGPWDTFDACCIKIDGMVKNWVSQMVNYYETENYIFVHSWIPIISQNDGYYRYDNNWREAHSSQWDRAMWGNPFDMHFLNLNQTGKTIVFGHWHCSAGHKMLGHCEDEFNYAIWEPCYADGIIGIDRCTAYTGKVNVLVLEDELCKD